jgi:hypothetical protein
MNDSTLDVVGNLLLATASVVGLVLVHVDHLGVDVGGEHARVGVHDETVVVDVDVLHGLDVQHGVALLVVLLHVRIPQVVIMLLLLLRSCSSRALGLARLTLGVVQGSSGARVVVLRSGRVSIVLLVLN